MKKLFTLLTLLFILTTLSAQTKIYLNPGVWETSGAKYQAYVWNADGNAWSTVFTLVPNEPATIYEATLPDETWDGIIILRKNPTGFQENSWVGEWDRIQTTFNGNFLSMTSWNEGSWSTYTPPVLTEPTVNLTISSKVFLDEEITFSVSSENITEPVYTYLVKVPESEEFVSASSPYQPETAGTYTFKVEVAADAEPAIVLATDEKDVIVNMVPEPIVIKVKMHEEWNPAAGTSLWIWNDDIVGEFVVATLSDDWYSYTFERTESINFIFVNATGNWPGDYNLRTPNVEDVTASTCYEIGELVEDVNVSGRFRREANVVDCGDGGEPTGSFYPSNDANLISIDKNQIKAHFEGTKQIQLYTISGQLLHTAVAENQFSYTVKSGIYLLRIDGQTYKLAAQ